MKIENIELTQNHIGTPVIYVPSHLEFEEGELGQIKSWNDRFIFVNYLNKDGTMQGTAKATNPEDLIWA